MLKNGFLALLAGVSLFGAGGAYAGSHDHNHDAAQASDVLKATTQKITDQIHLIHVKGGNVILFTGEDGLFLVDNDYTQATPAVLAAVKEISDEHVRFVINTHWHGDHTGGNETLGKGGSLIVAHDNVRKRLSVDNYIEVFDMKSTAAPKVALPIVTYDGHTVFHINGEAVRVEHVKNAHTDGDSIIHFENANVIHAGDVYFNGFYPFIDSSTGGSLAGVIDAADRVLALSNEETRIIPGHGSLSNKAELTAYRDMLIGVRDVLQPMIKDGKSFDEIKSANPLEPFNEQWGNGFLSPEVWLKIVYDAMVL